MDIRKWFRKAEPTDGPKKKLTRTFKVVHKPMPAEMKAAHDHSLHNRSELLSSEIVGCFYCQQNFDPADIVEWHDDEPDTGFCPHCGIDALIGSASGFKPSSDFLKEMNQYWF